MRIRFIGPEALHLGFASAGVDCVSAESEQEALAIITRTMDDPAVGILLIAATLAEPIQEELDRFRNTRAFPLILVVPDLHQEAVKEQDVLRPLFARFGLKVM